MPASTEPVRLLLNPDGTLAAEIPYPSGRTVTYLLVPDCAPAARWRLQLVRADNQTAYQVDRRPGDAWSCTCPAFRYRSGLDSQGRCKHAVFAARLYDLLVRLGEAHEG